MSDSFRKVVVLIKYSSKIAPISKKTGKEGYFELEFDLIWLRVGLEIIFDYQYIEVLNEIFSPGAKFLLEAALFSMQLFFYWMFGISIEYNQIYFIFAQSLSSGI